MATAEELRATIEQRGRELRTAIEQAASVWESEPAEGEWAPRATAEHAVGAMRSYAGMVARAVEREAPEGRDVTAATPAEAVQALEAAIADTRGVFAQVRDEQLRQSTELGGEIPSPDVPKTVDGLLWLTAWHIDDHAQQIAAAS